MDETQKFVTGTVRLKFFKGNLTIVGRKSPYSLYDYGLATYDRDTTFDEKSAAGFIYLDTLSLKTWSKVQRVPGSGIRIKARVPAAMHFIRGAAANELRRRFFLYTKAV